MPVASHTLSWSVNVTNALNGAQTITAIQLTLNTDNKADAISAAQQALSGADALVNASVLNSTSATFT
jgi:hypothetical protein